MTERVRKHYDLLKSKEYKSVRRECDLNVGDAVAKMDVYMTDAYMLRYVLELETPVLIEDDIFGFNRTVIGYPYAVIDGKKLSSGGSGNITPGYGRALTHGLDDICRRIKEKMSTCEEDKLPFYNGALECVSAVLDFADKY